MATPSKKVWLKPWIWIVMVVVLLLGLTAGYFFLTRTVSYGALFPSANFDGQNAAFVTDDGVEKYFFEGVFLKTEDRLLDKTYELGITEPYLNTSYTVAFGLPKTASFTTAGECLDIYLEYQNILGFKIFKEATVSECNQDSATLEYDFFLEIASNFMTDLTEEMDEGYSMWLTCEPFSTECEPSPTDSPPYPWVRYAEFAVDYADGGVDDYSQYLSELSTVDPSNFESRLYQYGDIILSSPESLAEYKDDYVNILETRYDQSYFEDYGMVITIDYYTEDTVSPAANAYDFSGTDLVNSANMSSVSSIEFANAYSMTADEKYLIGIKAHLNHAQLLTYLQADIESDIADEIYFKPSTCYLMQAGVRAYEATGIYDYVAYTLYIIQRGDIEKIYGERTPFENNSVTSNPMNILPCIDALEKLYFLDPVNATAYNSAVETLYYYMLEAQMIELNTLSGGYGAVKGVRYITDEGGDVDELYEVSSTGWWIYLLTQAQKRKEHNAEYNFIGM